MGRLDIVLAAAFYGIIIISHFSKRSPSSSSCNPNSNSNNSATGGIHNGNGGSQQGSPHKPQSNPVNPSEAHNWVKDIRTRALGEKTFWRGYVPFCPPSIAIDPDVATMARIGDTGGQVKFEDDIITDGTNAGGFSSSSSSSNIPIKPIPKLVHKVFFLPPAFNKELGFNVSSAYAMTRDQLPIKLQSAFTSWEGELNPGHKVQFWNERRIRKFLKEEYGKELLDVFDMIIPESWRSNLARFAIVAKLGGWYSDIQTVLLRKISELGSEGGGSGSSSSSSSTDFDLPLFFCDRIKNTLQAAVFRAPENHPWLLRSIDIIKHYVKTRTYGENPHMTGPLALGQASKVDGCCKQFNTGSLDLKEWRKPKVGFFVSHRGQKHGNGFAFAKKGGKNIETAEKKGPNDDVEKRMDEAGRALTEPWILYKYTKFLRKDELEDGKDGYSKEGTTNGGSGKTDEAKPYPENSYWQYFRDQNGYRTEEELKIYQKNMEILEAKLGEDDGG